MFFLLRINLLSLTAVALLDKNYSLIMHKPITDAETFKGKSAKSQIPIGTMREMIKK